MHGDDPRHGFSMVGMLITMVCICVLMVILLNSMNQAVTGGREAKEGTVYSVVDQTYLRGLHMSLVANAGDRRNRYLVPSDVDHSGDRSRDTTANLFSAMVMGNYTDCKQLISKNEFSGYVELYEGYDTTAYAPADGMYWDANFRADLADLSHVSFAHMPLYGTRFTKHWQADLDGNTPLLGNRGPKDGDPNPDSWTYSLEGNWGAHILYGDGHIEFTDVFTPGRAMFTQGGQRYADNIYKLEDGLDGADAVLSFTRTMGPAGPELQYD